MIKLDNCPPGSGWGRVLLAAGLSLLLGTAAHAQKAGFFRDEAAARAASPLASALAASRPLVLDVAGLRSALATAPLEARTGGQPLVLTLPLPDGTNARFRVVEAPVMEAGLAAQFPAIKTYAGVGIDDARATVRLDLTPQGFHAQVLSATTGTFFIDPAARPDASLPTSYLSFWKRNMPGGEFACSVVDDVKKDIAAATGLGQRTSGPTLRTYRLAMAATAEYTAYQNRNAPGATTAQQIANAQAAIVTTVNRVVGVYEKEVAVRMVLVANNSQLIYTDAATDPYDNSNTGNALLAQNQTNVDAIIGSANYDVGHVLSTASGGVAGRGVVCRAGNKARGTTGTTTPVGDSFDIDYVAHELGHQFGCNHTFNGNTGSCGGGNRSATTAYEPGSGTTIMAYAGICLAASNTQANSDAYFHVVSFEEILTYLATTSCGATSATGNNPPTVQLPMSGKVLPISTPFKLTAAATDPDNDAVTYCWEEFDLGSAGTPRVAQVADDNVPLFRSFYPTSSPTRYFPRLSNLVAGTTNIGERLPTVSRTLSFRVTIRDRFTTANTGFGVVGAVNSSPTVTMYATSQAGPFVVTYPDGGGLSLAGGSSQTVTWDVAGTNANDVNCATVNILLSTDGGLTYPTVLLANTPNDGTQAVTLPTVNTNTARIMVEAADNYFFDISNNDFAINSAAPCGTATNVTVTGVSATGATVNFAAATGATSYVITTLPASTSQTVTGTTATLSGLTAGTPYQVLVQSVCAGNATSTAASATFTTSPGPPCNEATNLTSTVQGSTITVSFTASATATSYTVTTSPATTTQTITGNSVTLSGLQPGVRYNVYVTSTCAGGGTAVATIAVALPPANDACTNAVSLTPATSCNPVSGTVSGATDSGLAAATCSSATSTTTGDVWYSFIATSTSHQVLVTTPSLDVVVQLVTGSCTSLVGADCVDLVGSGTETLSLSNLTPGTRYLVRVYAYTNGTTIPAPQFGAFTICVTGPAPTCAVPTDVVVSNTSGTSSALTFTNNALGATYTVTTAPATTTYTTNGTSPLLLTGLTPGATYTVTLRGTCSNGSTLAPVTVTFTAASALATAPSQELAQVSIVPNPARGAFAVQVPSLPGQRAVQATLLTVLGQPVLSRSLQPTGTGAAADFDVRGLAPGVYVLRLTAGDQSLVRRVVLE